MKLKCIESYINGLTKGKTYKVEENYYSPTYCKMFYTIKNDFRDKKIVPLTCLNWYKFELVEEDY